MLWFKLRMFLLVALMFSIIYAIIAMVAYSFGISNFYFYLALSLVMMFVQYMLGPKLVEWTMHVRYLKAGELPRVQSMVRDLALRANIPVPRVGIAAMPIPNAFAFGRWLSDGRVCVTDGILNLLSEDELRAVLGHEITHLKNRDVLTITLLSVIPLILYRVAWHVMFYGGGRGRRENAAPVWLVGLAAFLAYFITNLLVLYASRIREYFADRGSVELGNPASHLASALYKLVYGSSRVSRESMHQVEGVKAFFVNDPSCALRQLKELSQLDTDYSGSIDARELEDLRMKQVQLSFADKMLELFSTHPNMLKRIKKLSQWQCTRGIELS